MTQQAPKDGDPRLRDVRRIAVLRANGIGDFVATLPALGALRARFPEAAITLIGDRWLPGLVDGRPGPWSRTVLAPAYPGLRGLPSDAGVGGDSADFLAEQRRCHYDLAVQLHGGGRNSNALVAGLGARVSIGARTPDAAPLDRTVPYPRHRNEVLRCLDVVALVGASLDGVAALRPRLTVTGRDLVESRTRLAGDEPLVVVHAGARDARRRWATGSFTEVALSLAADGFRVVLVGGAPDRDVSEQICARCPGSVNLAGELSLAGLVGLMSRAALFVGNDSGPRHLAVAAGAPTVGVFWVGNLLTFGPLVGGQDRVAVSFRSDCPVCGREQDRDRCEHDVSFVDDVTVGSVLEDVHALLRAGPGRPVRTR